MATHIKIDKDTQRMISEAKKLRKDNPSDRQIVEEAIRLLKQKIEAEAKGNADSEKLDQ
jgi:electron transfer flavoprotein alpha/beta subunit